MQDRKENRRSATGTDGCLTLGMLPLRPLRVLISAFLILTICPPAHAITSAEQLDIAETVLRHLFESYKQKEEVLFFKLYRGNLNLDGKFVERFKNNIPPVSIVDGNSIIGKHSVPLSIRKIKMENDDEAVVEIWDNRCLTEHCDSVRIYLYRTKRISGFGGGWKITNVRKSEAIE